MRNNQLVFKAIYVALIWHVLVATTQAQTMLTDTIAAGLPEELRDPLLTTQQVQAPGIQSNTSANTSSDETNTEPSPLAPPPVVTSIDEAGVNVISGMSVIQQSDLSIGNGISRLDHTIATYDGKFWGLYDDFTISIQRGPTPAYTTVTIGHESQIFAHSTGSSGEIIYSPLNEDGATLTRDSNNQYTYTRADGMVYQQASQRIIYPNGFAITIHYGNEQPYTDVFGQTQYRKRRQAVTTNTGLMFKYHYRTEGYPSYSCDFPFTGKSCSDAHSEFYYPDNITAINTAVEYCNPTANQCTLSHTWPEVQYQWPAAEDMFARYEYGAATARAVFSITDAEGVSSEYTHQRFGIKKPSGEAVLSIYGDWEHVTRLTSIKAGTSASQATATLDYEDFVQSFPAEALNVIIQKVRNMLVTEVSINGATYDYDHKQPDTPYRKTGTSIGPRGTHTSVMALHGVLDVKVSTTTPRYHTTYNEHQQHNRIETSRDYGQTVSYQQDSRGNITGRTQQAITGIANDNSPDITEEAHYPTTCTSLKTCNQPEWVEDGNGNRTDYTYHAPSGQVASITYPANRSGTRAQRRFYYQQHYAQVKNASGELVNADSAVWLLSKERYCRNSAANGDTCAVAGDEVIINYHYSPENLWLTGKVVSADGKQQRTCYQYNELGQRIGTILPNAGLSQCSDNVLLSYQETNDEALPTQAAGDFLTASRFNLKGQVTGTIAPDPDNQLLKLSGSTNDNSSESAGESNGPLKFLATRHTYNAQGMKVITELGELSQWQDNTVAPADWGANFTIHTATHYTYDNYGRTLSERVRSGSNIHRLTEFSYDTLGQLQCQTIRMNPDTFGSNRNACTLSDPADRITRFTYDSDGFVLKEQRAWLTSLAQDYATYEYDQHKSRTSVTDANGNLAKLEYDGHKRLKTWYFPTKTSIGAGTHNSADYEQYQYDNNHNRTQLRKRDGRIIGYQYNALNQLIKKDWPGTTNLDVYYGYNLQGLPLYTRYKGHASSNNGVTQQFDGFGNLSQSQLRMPVFGSSENESQTRTLTFNYDSNNNRTRVQFPDGEAFQYHYDGLNRLYQIQQPNQSALFRQTYRPNGGLYQQQRFSLSNTDSQTSAFANTTLDYDGALRPAALSHTFPALSQNSEQNPEQNPESQANPYNIRFDYQYNPANQITQRETSNHQYHYNGNHNVTGSYERNGLNQYTSVNGTSISHDNNGNLQNDGEYQFTFDVENRLINATHNNTGEVTALTYDPLGRLFSVNHSDSSNTTLAHTEFLYNGNQLAGEYNQNNQLLRRYLHQSAGDNNSHDQPLIWFEGSSTAPEQTRHLFANHNGSIISVTNHNGSEQHINTYDAYGLAHNLMGRFAYTGQIQLPEIQLTRPSDNSQSTQPSPLYHYKARSYHPTLGRFLQTDPVGYEDQMNLYAYVGNDPVNMVDPSGEFGVALLFVPEILALGKATVFTGTAILAGYAGSEALNVYNESSTTGNKEQKGSKSKDVGTCPDCGGKTTSKEGKIAKDHDLTVRDVKDKMHGGAKNTIEGNPDIEVCRDCGGMFPKTQDNSLGDVIDYIDEKDY